MHVDDPVEEPSAQYYDQISGAELDPALVAEARSEEISFMDKRGQWKLVPKEEAKGRKIIGTRFVDVNKGDFQNPNVRSRLVAQDMKLGQAGSVATFAATPPIEALKLLFAIHMQQNHDFDQWVLIFIDVKKAHLLPRMKKEVFFRPPKECEVPEGMVAKLIYCIYGLREAGSLFDEFMDEVLEPAGYKAGVYSPSVFYHVGERSRMLKHGDDLVISARRGFGKHLIKVLESKMELKVRAVLGARTDLGDVQETSILNRFIKLKLPGEDGSRCVLECEADPRHAEILASQLGLTKESKGCVSPGVKLPSSRPASELVGPEDKFLFRSSVMRAQYLGIDRADIQFAVKEMSSKLSCPTHEDMAALKRLARYLVSFPRSVWLFPRERPARMITMACDSDWAGNDSTRKSTSGNAAYLGNSCVRTTSTNQAVIALSAGEAEFYSVVRGTSSGIGLGSICCDFGLPELSVQVNTKTDSSACIGIANRRGAGKIRHIQTPTLWIQQGVANGSVVISKIPGKENGSNLLTKHVDGCHIAEELKLMHQVRCGGRHSLAPRSQV